MRVDAYALHFNSTYETAQSTLTRITQKGDMIHTVNLNHESQNLSLSAEAKVQTSQGDLEINLATILSQEERYKVETIVAQSAVDPLVINLSGELASVDTQKTFLFDLDSDGQKEAMALLKEGNGFLALDTNENGKIDDGSELFGTKSGNGFADLSLYDDDKNGVIDENDAIFDKLRIWQKSALENQLITVKQARVGALLLENVSSMFSYQQGGIKSADLRSSGIALFEDGRASWMSHVDFYVEEKESTQNTDATQNSVSQSLFNQLKTSTPASNTQETLIEMLEKRLHMLEAKLQKTHNKDEKQALQLQILTLSQNIASLQGA